MSASRPHEAARIAWTAATVSCRPDPVTGARCDTQHRVWPTLRRLGVVPAPASYAAFYRSMLGERVRAGASHVLVCAPTDDALLELVDAAWGGEASRVEVGVAARCATTLHLNRTYADRRGLRVTGLPVGPLAVRAMRAWDAIVSFDLLGSLDPLQRRTLVGSWAGGLRPDGVAVAVQRIHPGTTGAVRFAPADVEALAARVRAAAIASPEVLPAPLEAIVGAARTWAQHHVISVIGSVEDLVAPFAAYGLTVEVRDLGPDPHAPAAVAGSHFHGVRAVEG